MKCNMDCFNCVFPDCVNDRVYPESNLYKNRPEEQKQYQKEYARKKRQEAKEKGFCIICRKKPATKGAKCYECFLRQKRHDKSKYDGRREEWKRNGLCYFCGEKCVEDKKVCEKHYKYLIKNIDICNQSENTKRSQKDFKEYYWKSRGRKNEQSF